MSKAIIVVDFAYKGLKRIGRGTGYQGLRTALKYMQYRDRQNNTLAQSKTYERWQDRGLGVHHRQILERCSDLHSKHVLAWTWVISPAPDLMTLLPENERRTFLYDLTERVVEAYYAERGFDTPEYSYLMHHAKTNPGDGQAPQEHLHTHVILPGTAPFATDRMPVYNNLNHEHDRLFREVASREFANALDRSVGFEWRRLRDMPDNDRSDISDSFFSL